MNFKRLIYGDPSRKRVRKADSFDANFFDTRTLAEHLRRNTNQFRNYFVTSTRVKECSDCWKTKAIWRVMSDTYIGSGVVQVS